MTDLTGRGRATTIYVVTLKDQRNHGQRTMNKRGNQEWCRKSGEHIERFRKSLS